MNMSITGILSDKIGTIQRKLYGPYTRMMHTNREMVQVFLMKKRKRNFEGLLNFAAFSGIVYIALGSYAQVSLGIWKAHKSVAYYSLLIDRT